MIFVIATVNVKPEDRDAFFEASRPCLEGTRKEAGCISYDLNADISDPGKAVFVERWENRAALDNHFTQPHLVAWRENAGKFITSRRIEIIEDAKVEVR